MKKKVISLVLSSALLGSGFTLSASAADPAASDSTETFSPEYLSSPFYEKLTAALDDSKDKTTMEKALAAALSQEGYQNYSLVGTTPEEARKTGFLWTGKEHIYDKEYSGNTEYTRWAQSCLMGRSGEALYADIDWCAIFSSWCMYQAGYYTKEQLKKYYYSYYADPRQEYDADSWITAFCLDQENVWYTPAAARKLEAYSWNTYYHTETDPFDIPYKPGGLIFFSWDGSGQYFNHVGMVVSYDSDDHILTYINGNTEGSVITRTMDLDKEEEFHGHPLLVNSKRIMAYGEYDEIRPLEQKEITSDTTEIVWDKNSDSGFKINTDSRSKIVSVSLDGEYLGSNIESNMILNNGRVSVGKSELINTPVGAHELMFTFDDGVLTLPFIVEETKDITPDPASLTWDRQSGEDITVETDSGSDTVGIRIGGASVGTEETEGVTLENGVLTLSAEFAASVLADGENTVRLVFSDGETEISIFVKNEKEESESSEESSEPESSEESSEPESSEESSEPESPEESSEPESSEESSEPESSEEDAGDTEESETYDDTSSDDTDAPATGEAYPYAVILVIALSCGAAVLAVRRGKRI